MTLAAALVFAPRALAEVTALSGPVDDRADLLPAAAESMLREDLQKLQSKTGHRFALLTLSSLGGADMEQYARGVVEASKLGGGPGHEDWLLLMIVREGKLVGLLTGHDLEQAIPNTTAFAQVREDLQPAVNRGAPVEGIFIVFQRWMNAVGGVGTSTARDGDKPAELSASVAEKIAQRAERAGSVTLQVPALVGAVNDYAGLLSASERSRIDEQLRNFREKSGPQFAVLIVRSLEGLSVEDYAMKVAETWKLGHAGVDDGLLLLVAKDDRKMRIEVGYGLEGAIPDVLATRTIREALTPAFKQREFATGITAAFYELMSAVDGQARARPAPRAGAHASWEQQKRSENYVLLAFFTPFVLGFGFFFFFVGLQFWRGKLSFLGLHLDEQRKLRYERESRRLF